MITGELVKSALYSTVPLTHALGSGSVAAGSSVQAVNNAAAPKNITNKTGNNFFIFLLILKFDLVFID